MISDNGPQFISEMFEHLSNRLGIQLVKTVVCRPQSNRTERVNHDLLQMIASYVNDNHETWDQFLREFTYALRTVVNETTGRPRQSCFWCEEYFEKLSDSQERLPVNESLYPKCIQLPASEPKLQLGSDRLPFHWTLRSSPGEGPRLVLDIRVSVSAEYHHRLCAVKSSVVKSIPCHTDNFERRGWSERRMSNADDSRRNWRNSEVVRRPSNGRNDYRVNYENGRQRNQWFDSKKRFQKNDPRFNDRGYQFINGGQKDDFSRGDSRNRGSKAQKAFSVVKAAITKAPVLKLPFELFTDASSIVVGAVLNQEQRPVVFTSHPPSNAERNYTVTERECLAVVWALNKFRTYLGSLPIKVITDHAALTRLTNGKNLSNRMIRWVLKLAEFNIEWEHRSTTQNAVAEVLSRNPVESIIGKKVNCAIIRDLVLSSLEQLIEEQRKDPELGHIYRYLENTDDSSVNVTICENRSRDFRLIEALLFYAKYATSLGEMRVYIPKSLRNEIMREFHEKSIAGHFGRFKTYHEIRDVCYFPYMRKFTCATCAKLIIMKTRYQLVD
ncbi:retrovirus-related Pol polyprotein from transposon 17.6 [Trichonephila clavipes]|nr:retrovirus-related Pol polyprotein from transposon 17.6 [Trichonephila clavipes]